MFTFEAFVKKLSKKKHMSEKSRKKQIVRVTLIGTLANFLLLVFKFVAGIVGHSGAMIADAVHSLSDFVTDVIVLVFVRLSSKPKDAGHDYGHGKYETLATSIIGMVLLFVGVGIFWDGLHKIIAFFRGEALPAPGRIALVAAVVSIVVKELLYRITKTVGVRVGSQVVVANAWHHRSDAFSSVGTLVGVGGAILLGPHWRVLDPLAAVAVSFFIAKVSLQLLLPAINDLLEKSLPKETEDEILAIIDEVEGIYCPHNLLTRRIGNNYAIEVHVRVDGRTPVEEAHRMTRVIERKLRDRFGAGTHVAVHVEPLKEPAGNCRPVPDAPGFRDCGR